MTRDAPQQRRPGRRRRPCLSMFLTMRWLIAVAAISVARSSAAISDDETWITKLGSDLDPHPDPNDENHEGMVYVGRHEETDGDIRRVSFEYDNAIRYIFGTSFDEAHHVDETELLHHDGHELHDLPERLEKQTKTRDQVLDEARHGKIDLERGPKPYGHVDTHPLDGGVTPVKVVRVEPFWLDTHLVTNKQFAKFVQATAYETEAEKYGWSFVLSSFIGAADDHDLEVDPAAPHWVAVPGAYWRRPEGEHSSYKHREHHPVTHVSHKDAAEYCQWRGKRLPGEWEWEAAARAGHFGPHNRTLYSWGNDVHNVATAAQHANLWGNGSFPHENFAEDGWRGTSPVGHYPPNDYGVYDMIGNVWEWMRGGKHKSRIVRGASFVDTVDGHTNHAATLGARSTLHGTTTTGNVGFRCAKAPTRRVEHHYQWHDESEQGVLAVEDEFGVQHMVPPQHGWEDRFDPDYHEDGAEDQDDDDATRSPRRKKRKVIKKRERLSTEL